ncbi:DUF3604 domain-containing protein [Halioxenophilus sp. WMMB6]|uniref:DUF3604 domain-containing protein n=1 Tax=Halioxenophilus sp. WMMB6 TaxID=3073815 RepID=UPI00295E8EC2|nr:DUF3604 domain-containing protein [Halioxenophilus sp. WMMB6]
MLKALLFLLCGLTTVTASADSDEHCPGFQAGEKRLLWGDLHVHTSYSLDAYAFGVRHTGAEAFSFGRGQPLLERDGKSQIVIDRPLDFMAVTDHAESFAVIYLCTDPATSNTPYCQAIREQSHPATAWNIFRNYLLPLITPSQPTQPAPLCGPGQENCEQAAIWQWQRAQREANAANDPCDFTAFVAQEWSATPGAAHIHRNLIFRTESVPDKAFDYLTYNSPEKLWRALQTHCTPEADCDVLAIPHNSNLAEGLGFDVEHADNQSLKLRAHYERLLEVHQSKGSSECLPISWTDDSGDCGFERVLSRETQQALAKQRQEAEQAWQSLRSGYARSLLERGLVAYDKSGDARINPLQLGLIGSTDTHVAAPGFVAEDTWRGDAFGWGGAEERFQRITYNPGGLVAVWAEENTRDAIFKSLWDREAYATSGPRIGLRVFADDENKARCSSADASAIGGVPMGGVLPDNESGSMWLTVIAQRDKTPLQRIEVIKGSLINGQVEEQVIDIANSKKGRKNWCVSWQDLNYQADVPAFWYVRVLEKPTPRWSKRDCEKADLCKKYPEADIAIQERAWSSPIWNHPGHN